MTDAPKTVSEIEKMEQMVDLQLVEVAYSPSDPYVAEQRAAYASTIVSGNANSYVPWDDPQIPYHCDCGEIIYSDTPHRHPGDPEVVVTASTDNLSVDVAHRPTCNEESYGFMGPGYGPEYYDADGNFLP